MRNSLVVVRIDNIYIYNIYTAECIELSTVGLAPARPNYAQNNASMSIMIVWLNHTVILYTFFWTLHL